MWSLISLYNGKLKGIEIGFGVWEGKRHNSATQFPFLFNQITKKSHKSYHQKLFWWSSAISVILWKLKIWAFIRCIPILPQIPAFCVLLCFPRLFFFHPQVMCHIKRWMVRTHVSLSLSCERVKRKWYDSWEPPPKPGPQRHSQKELK